MDLPNHFNALNETHPAGEPSHLHHLFDGLPPALKTMNNLALLNTYYHIPTASGRRFVQALVARLAGIVDAAYAQDGPAEAEYLLTHYAQLPTDNMRAMMLSVVRQICVANGGDLESFYETLSPPSPGKNAAVFPD